MGSVADVRTSLRETALLPTEAPMAMSVQPLWAHADRRADVEAVTPRLLGLRRLYIFGGTAGMTALGAEEMYEVLKVGGVTPLEGLVLALFVLLFAWIAFSFMSATAGFVALMTRATDALGVDAATPLPSLTKRTAMLLPTYNEDPHRILARLRAMCESVVATGQGASFDWYILSDTTDPSVWIAEEKAVLQLRREFTASNIYYRHRPANVAKKAGNIEDWVKRFGAGYDHMLILDADSLMTGEAIVRLAAAMERHPGVGLIQTLPIVVNARTLFARLQQFAGRLYGPLIAAGIAWWHGSEGNYWGHNAIIRTRAFAEAAGLPELSGRKPFGGHIMSHDFIEAALMRRAGWAIHMAPTLHGSFEESPSSLLDFAARDRRWCQGNLQHIAILPARGLHWVSRLHLMSGIGSYLTAPLWLMFLLLGIVVSLQAQFVRPEYFPRGFALFPEWPAQDPIRAAWVFAGTMALLLLPKLMSFVVLLTRRDDRRRFGGGFRTFGGILVETLLSGLVAPVMMMFQSSAVAEILLGRDAGWQVQRRDDGSATLREVARKCAVPTAMGLVMGISAYSVSWALLLWMSPVILGLLLAVPIALLLSTTRAERAPGEIGLFDTPERTAPPSELARALDLDRVTRAPDLSALQALRADPDLFDAHLASLAGLAARERGQIDPHLAVARAKIADAESFPEAVSYLGPREVFATLLDRDALQRLMSLPDVTSGAKLPELLNKKA
jgi:membrane glycosyltransferase